MSVSGSVQFKMFDIVRGSGVGAVQDQSQSKGSTLYVSRTAHGVLILLADHLSLGSGVAVTAWGFVT
jgi:hypothetical protein